MPAADETFKVFDINLRQHFYDKETILNTLNKCNVLKINDEDLTALRDMFGYSVMSDKEVCRALIFSYDLKILILTCGTDGSYVYTCNEESYMPTLPAELLN